MDIVSMHLAVNLGLQRIASHVFDDFQPEEIDLYLNDAILKFVESNKDLIIASPNSPEAVKASEDLRTIIKTKQYASANVNSLTDVPNGKTVTLTDATPAFGWYLYSRSDVGTDKWKNNRLVSVMEFFQYAKTATNDAVFRELPAYISGDLLNLIHSTEDTNITKVYLVYLTYPATVKYDHVNAGAGNVSCDLPSHTHQRIVDLTVELMHEDLKKGGE